jgi:RimJ/RimL family protein N-acetyltransferase
MENKYEPAADYILEDDSVRLRPLKESDIEFLLPFALNEPDTWRYSHVSARGEQGMHNYISSALANRLSGKEYPFIVFDKKTNQYAGSTRFYDIQPENDTLQLGYTWYGERFRGTGLNKHCKFLLLQFAFEKLGMQRVEFRADARNERSIAAMKSIGCKVEGILRSSMALSDGGRRDSIVLSILKNEWESEVKENLLSRL